MHVIEFTYTMSISLKFIPNYHALQLPIVNNNILIIVNISVTKSQTPTETSTIDLKGINLFNSSDGLKACNGKVITFTCKSKGSPIIAWSSDTYIGMGNVQLAFAAEIDNVGTKRSSSSNPNTVAELVTKEIDSNGTQILISNLTITTTTEHSGDSNIITSSVTCINIGDGSIKTLDFQVLGKYLFMLFIIILLYYSI